MVTTPCRFCVELIARGTTPGQRFTAGQMAVAIEQRFLVEYADSTVRRAMRKERRLKEEPDRDWSGCKRWRVLAELPHVGGEAVSSQVVPLSRDR